LAEEFGLNKKLLTPRVHDSNDEGRDKIARQLSFYASSQDSATVIEIDEEPETCDDGYDQAPQEVTADDDPAPSQSKGDSNKMLAILHELTTMMTQRANINAVFKKVLDGIHQGVGFDRAMLMLVTPDHKAYVGRMAVGESTDSLRGFFQRNPIQTKTDLFSKLIMEGTEVLVSDLRDGGWDNMLPAHFAEKVGANSFLIAAIRVRGRPVGMFYGDKFRQNQPISSEDHRGFMQLVAQAQLALQVR
jgi:hypothetical protein